MQIATELYASALSLVLADQSVPEWTEKLPRFRFYKLKVRCALQWQVSQELLAKHIRQESKPVVILLNGRLPGQAAIRKFCELREVDFLILEQGLPKNLRFHMQPFQTQETRALRNLNEVRRDQLRNSQRRERVHLDWSKKWLEDQKSSENNKFAIWNKSTTKSLKHNAVLAPADESKTMSFFNSSLEERFTNLGMEMNGWRNQLQALTSAMKTAKDSNYTTILRFHPNYLRKNSLSFLRLNAVTKRYADKIHLPWDEFSTPRLIESSAVVVTWGSTVSLESTAIGKPTVLLGRTSYDNLIDISLCDPSNVSRMLENLVVPNPSKTEEAIYLAKNLGFPLDSQIAHELLYSKREKSKTTLYFKSLKAVMTKGLSATPQDFIVILQPLIGHACIIRLLNGLTNSYCWAFNWKSKFTLRVRVEKWR